MSVGLHLLSTTQAKIIPIPVLCQQATDSQHSSHHHESHKRLAQPPYLQGVQVEYRMSNTPASCHISTQLVQNVTLIKTHTLQLNRLLQHFLSAGYLVTFPELVNCAKLVTANSSTSHSHLHF